MSPRSPTIAYPYCIVLAEADRAQLRGLVGVSMAPARMLARARILLKADHSEGGPGWTDAAIAGALDVNPSTVLRLLADELVRREVVETISHETVRQSLRKTS